MITFNGNDITDEVVEISNHIVSLCDRILEVSGRRPTLQEMNGIMFRIMENAINDMSVNRKVN